jgi:hypothetical protein
MLSRAVTKPSDSRVRSRSLSFFQRQLTGFADEPSIAPDAKETMRKLKGQCREERDSFPCSVRCGCRFAGRVMECKSAVEQVECPQSNIDLFKPINTVTLGGSLLSITIFHCENN